MENDSTPTDAVSAWANADGSERGRVLLLVDSEANRRLLKEELSKRFEVDVTNGPLEMSEGVDEWFDICIIDRPSYQRNRESLVTYKERMEPVFVPFLLVGPPSDETVIDPQSEAVIDEIIETPIRKAKLAWRIERLLEMRRLTLELAHQKERLDDFATMVSHDLRSPLNIAQGYLGQAEESGEIDDFERVASALDRMERIIEDVLALARLGQETVKVGSVHLSEVVEAAWNGVETANASSNFEIEKHRVVADEGRLRQLLENLYRNAIEHAGDDVAVRVGTLESGFYVEDDGPGIPESEREQVFESGYSTAKDGTGFGLSIVQQIVDAHGWNLRVMEGTEGGTRFEITGVETE